MADILNKLFGEPKPEPIDAEATIIYWPSHVEVVGEPTFGQLKAIQRTTQGELPVHTRNPGSTEILSPTEFAALVASAKQEPLSPAQTSGLSDKQPATPRLRGSGSQRHRQ